MADPAGGAGFAEEPFAKLCCHFVVEVDTKRFEGNATIDEGIAREVDDSHCAATQGLLDLIATYLLDRHRDHCSAQRSWFGHPIRAVLALSRPNRRGGMVVS
jgi:hypothetical protein